MRPKTIVAFEWLYVFTLLIGVIYSAIMWDEVTAISSPIMVLTVQGFSLIFVIGLVLWTSRGRSNVAKWINVILFVLGLPGEFMLLTSDNAIGWPLASAVQALIQAVALGLLFSPSARHWLTKSDALPSHGELKQTFE